MSSLSSSVHPSVRSSVRLSVCPSVRLSVRPSVRPSVCRSVTFELKTQETRIYDAAVDIECVWVYVIVWEGELGGA